MPRNPISLPKAGMLVLLLAMAGCTMRAEVAGLRPLYPEALTSPAEVDSFQPTLRWEAFPRPEDLEASDPGYLKRIDKVSYDLKVWRVENNRPVELVYSQQGLPEPAHRVQTPLIPSTDYAWTVRARFEIEGQPRVSEWGVIVNWGNAEFARRMPIIPNPFSYRFKTPD